MECQHCGDLGPGSCCHLILFFPCALGPWPRIRQFLTVIEGKEDRDMRLFNQGESEAMNEAFAS